MSKSPNLIIPAAGGVALMIGLAFGVASRDYGADKIARLESRAETAEARASAAAEAASEEAARAAELDARIAEIQGRIGELDAACVFAEPQFEPKLVRTVIQGTGARTATLDPLGARLKSKWGHVNLRLIKQSIKQRRR